MKLSFNKYKYHLPVLDGTYKKDHKFTDKDYKYIGSEIKPICLKSKVNSMNHIIESYSIINEGKKLTINTYVQPYSEVYDISYCAATDKE